MSANPTFDFWYAVNNTEVVLTPERRLETFGATVVNYHLVTELMDEVNKVRVREGVLKAHRPEIITPRMVSDELLEGFGADAQDYYDWLQEHGDELLALKYGFTIRKQEIKEEVVTDSMKAVVERVQASERVQNDPLGAVLVGVDQPWEVCLLKLMVELVQHSAAGNAQDVKRHHRQRQQSLREQIETGFLEASRDASRIPVLAEQLKAAGLFEKHEDRFFALVKAARQ
jgi:hypothetical protein